MELEFDKEINAILRKAKQHAGTFPTSVASPHLDADTIAAFAENALPDRARPPLIQHFAACDACRKMLSQTILLNLEADATAASSVVPEIIADTALPWYQRLFKMPGMALAMGAVVLAFTGVLGYLVLQNRNNASNAVVSEVKEPESTRGGPYYSGKGEATNSSSTVAPSFNSNSMTSNATSKNGQPVGVPETAANSAPVLAGRTDSGEIRTATALDDKGSVDGFSTGSATVPEKPAGGAPPPPPAPMDVTKTEADEKKPGSDKLNEREKDLELAKRKESDDRSRAYRDAPVAAAKAGPARSGPLQMQSNQVNNKSFDMPVSRVVGGKSFNNRDGAWYDTAYHGQSTTNVQRGTDNFRKLDGGLRSIANSLGGVVVVVWKNKAYRIQ